MKYNDKKSKENDKKNIEKSHDIHSQECEVGEDTTKYGEFISSYFAMGSITWAKRKYRKVGKYLKRKKKREKKRISEEIEEKMWKTR